MDITARRGEKNYTNPTVRQMSHAPTHVLDKRYSAHFTSVVYRFFFTPIIFFFFSLMSAEVKQSDQT